MQTLIDKNDALKKEIKALQQKVVTLKNKPIAQTKTKAKTGKKSMFSAFGFGKGNSGTAPLTPKQIEGINYLHGLILKEAYDEVDIYVAQNKKMLFGKTKKGSPEPNAMNLKDEFGETILMKAIKEGMTKQAGEWIENKTVDVNAVDGEGLTALMVSARFGEFEIAQKLVPTANRDAKTKFTKKTALHFAAEEAHFDIVELLLDNGCDPLLEDSEGNKPYELCKDVKTREFLVAQTKKQEPNLEIEEFKPAEEDQEKKRTYSQDEEMKPLFEEFEQLTKQRKRLELQVEDIKRKRAPKINPDKLKLVKNVKNANERVRKLHALVVRGNDADALEEVEEILTEKNKTLQIDKDAPDDLGETALMKAARLGFEEMLALLLLYKCNAECRDESGQTALMKASHFGKQECVQKLIEEGAEVNACSRKGKLTALMLAAERGHIEICEMLVKDGADHSMKNSNGETAIELVRNDAVRERLEKLISANPVPETEIQI